MHKYSQKSQRNKYSENACNQNIQIEKNSQLKLIATGDGELLH